MSDGTSAQADRSNQHVSGEKVWHALEADDVVRTLETSPKRGLTSEEADRRKREFGPNELSEQPGATLWQMLLEQFNNFIVIILLIAVLISALLGDYIEATAILTIVILNALLGIVQERRAEEALAALRRLAAPDARVIRNGKHQTVSARELVPGDVVTLESGNYVPADLRLVETVNLKIEEAALTGESVPVQKDARVVLTMDIALGDRRNTAFSGTLVSYGRGRGIVVNTGMRTQIGMIAAMLQAVKEEPTPLQRRLDQLGKMLGWAALVICGIVFIVGWIRGVNPLDMFLVAVSLAVAAVPEGLPAVVTITLALGMREMITKHALIRKLSSVETLGSTTVICSDKTGTLTQNQMTVTRLWVDSVEFEITGGGYEPVGDFIVDGNRIDLKDYPASTTALWVGALANDALVEIAEDDSGETAPRVVGDPTEAALVVAAAKAGADRSRLERAYPRIEEIPFDSTRKRMTTVHRIQEPHPEDASPFYDNKLQEWEVAAIKGAPDVVLDLCTRYQDINDRSAPLTAEMRQRILQANESMAQQALRVLAVAYRVEPDVAVEVTPEEVERDFIFVGLMGMIDPPRWEVRPAIQKARQAGIRTVMITGDYPDTARAIAQEIELMQPGHRVLTGADLNKLNDATLKREVMEVDVYARVSPEHKVRIVDALKHNDQVTAMTGDGVNDAPALKRADIGVAMGITGTDVAKETADMVLTDDNYASIVAAVEQGRIIYANIRKFVFYLLSCNLAEIVVIFTAVLAGLPSPLTPIQLLWLNLITDGAPALALGVEKGDPDTMTRPPRPSTESIINREMRIRITVQTVAIATVTLAAYLLGISIQAEGSMLADTMAFVTLSASELLRALTARSERYPILRSGIFTNKAMVIAVTTSFFMLLVVIYLPFFQTAFDTVALEWRHWQIVLPLLVIPSIVAEATKAIINRSQRDLKSQPV